jgi:aryl-alcohol dehydrogenase-like predicted oxidoreductase
LGGGLFTGKYRRGETGRLSARGDAVEGTMQRTAVVGAVLAIADDIDSTAVQVSLAWLRRRAELAPTALIPIVGPRSLTHLDECLGSLDLKLDEQHYRRLDEVSAIQMGAPREDVEAAFRRSFDGDRRLLNAPLLSVI